MIVLVGLVVLRGIFADSIACLQNLLLYAWIKKTKIAPVYELLPPPLLLQRERAVLSDSGLIMTAPTLLLLLLSLTSLRIPIGNCTKK